MPGHKSFEINERSFWEIRYILVGHVQFLIFRRHLFVLHVHAAKSFVYTVRVVLVIFGLMLVQNIHFGRFPQGS